MILLAVERAAADDRGDADRAVLDPGVGDVVGRLAPVRVREVGPSVRRQRGVAGGLQLLPADVRNLHACRQLRHPSGQEAQAGADAVLLALLEEKLHAEADAENRNLTL